MLLVPLLLAAGAPRGLGVEYEDDLCTTDADCLPLESAEHTGCVDDGAEPVHGCIPGRWLNLACNNGRCMTQPSCNKDHDCMIGRICNEDHRCVLGEQGCVEYIDDGSARYRDDIHCQRTTNNREEPSVIAQALNAAFDSESSGVLIHVLDGATEQTQRYKLCVDTRDPGCALAGDHGDLYDRPMPVCGRGAFSVVNKLAWSAEAQLLDGPWVPEEDEGGGRPPSPLIIATDVMLRTATCLFPGDAKHGLRAANGCGRSVSATCAANCGSASAACAAAAADEPIWCSQPGQFFDDGCAMRGTELPGMLEQFGSAWASGRAELDQDEMHWTTAVIDASTWNAAL
eukprot:COSAG04_NODE_596_length_12255_cov_4.614018_5_plen_343_part_00